MRPHQPTPAPHMKGDNRRQRETRPLQSPRSRPHQPTPTPYMKGDNRRQRETRPLQSPRWRQHQPTPTPHMKGDNRRQRETTGDKTTSEPKKPTTPTNTRQPETMGDNGRQDHFRAQEADHTNGRQGEARPLQSPRSRPHQPTPTPHMKGDNRRQRETTGDKTTSEPKKPTTATNTHPSHEGRQRETTGGTGDKTTSEPKKPTTPTNTRPLHEGRQPETTGDNRRQDHFRAQDGGHTNQHPPDKTTSKPKKPTTPTNTKAARSKVALRTPTVNCLGKKTKDICFWDEDLVPPEDYSNWTKCLSHFGCYLHVYIYIFFFSISYVYCTLNIDFFFLTIILTLFSYKLALFWQHMIFAIPQELEIVVWNLDPHGLRRKIGIWLRRNTAMVGFKCVLRLETNGK